MAAPINRSLVCKRFASRADSLSVTATFFLTVDPTHPMVQETNSNSMMASCSKKLAVTTTSSRRILLPDLQTCTFIDFSQVAFLD
jgi:hypothetical protein